MPEIRQGEWGIARQQTSNYGTIHALRRSAGSRPGECMIDREKVVSVLLKRFPEALLCDVAAAANAIVGLPLEFDPLDPAGIVMFRCETPDRQYDVHHVERGDVRVYCRVRPSGPS